jgi:hypothetical protein
MEEKAMLLELVVEGASTDGDDSGMIAMVALCGTSDDIALRSEAFCSAGADTIGVLSGIRY